jgi:hypothetical protein
MNEKTSIKFVTGKKERKPPVRGKKRSRGKENWQKMKR